MRACAEKGSGVKRYEPPAGMNLDSMNQSVAGAGALSLVVACAAADEPVCSRPWI